MNRSLSSLRSFFVFPLVVTLAACSGRLTAPREDTATSPTSGSSTKTGGSSSADGSANDSQDPTNASTDAPPTAEEIAKAVARSRYLKPLDCGDGDPSDPRVSDVRIVEARPNEVTLAWTTALPTSTRVEWDLEYRDVEDDNLWSRHVDDDALTTTHTATLTLLSSGTQHNFRVAGATADGATLADRRRCLQTPAYAPLDLPDGWRSRDINEDPYVAGTSTYLPDRGVIVVSGAGEGIFHEADTFRWVSVPVAGSFTLTLRVESYNGFLAEKSQAIVQFRNNASAGSAFVNTGLSYRFTDYFYDRPTQGEAVQNIDPGAKWYIARQGVGDAGTWLRLSRSVAAAGTSARFVQEFSADGAAWSTMGVFDTSEPALTAAGEAGFGVCSKQNGAVTEVHFSHVTLTQP